VSQRGRSDLSSRLKAGMVLSLLPVFMIAIILWSPVPVGQTEHTARAMRDFSNLWAAGQAVRQGDIHVLFSRPDYAGWIHTLYGSQMPDQMWGYPPSFLLVAVPLSGIPMVAAFILWTGTTLATLGGTVRAAGLTAMATAAVVFSPVAFSDALAGQNGGVTAALLVAGLSCIRRRPFLAGLCLGLLTVKPQVGLLIPFCLLAARDYRTIVTTVLVAAAMAVSSGLLFGWDAWVHFFTDTSRFMSAVLREPWTGSPAQLSFVSPWMAVRALGGGMAIACAIQVVVSLACATTTWRIWKRRPLTLRQFQIAATVPLVVLATPYAHDYDMVATAFSVAVLAAAGAFKERRPFERPVAALAWAWPGLVVLLPVLLPAFRPISGLVSCLVLGSLSLICWHRLEGKPSKDSLSKIRIEDQHFLASSERRPS
jgi:hypothetical protein